VLPKQLLESYFTKIKIFVFQSKLKAYRL